MAAPSDFGGPAPYSPRPQLCPDVRRAAGGVRIPWANSALLDSRSRYDRVAPRTATAADDNGDVCRRVSDGSARTAHTHVRGTPDAGLLHTGRVGDTAGDGRQPDPASRVQRPAQCR